MERRQEGREEERKGEQSVRSLKKKKEKQLTCVI
jgi:hypothetical protein